VERSPNIPRLQGEFIERAVSVLAADPQRGMRPMGVRRLETLTPDLARELEGTVADLNAPSLLRALAACVGVYRRLRDAEGSPLERHPEAEAVALAYLGDMGRKVGPRL
jgi:hypothetical protein